MRDKKYRLLVSPAAIGIISFYADLPNVTNKQVNVLPLTLCTLSFILVLLSKKALSLMLLALCFFITFANCFSKNK